MFLTCPTKRHIAYVRILISNTCFYKSANISTRALPKQARGNPAHKELSDLAKFYYDEGRVTYNTMSTIDNAADEGSATISERRWGMEGYEREYEPDKIARWRRIVQTHNENSNKRAQPQVPTLSQVWIKNPYRDRHGRTSYYHKNMYDVYAGMIIALRYHRGRHDRFRGKWPDVVFAMWKGGCEEYKAEIGGLNYVLQDSIDNKDTITLIREFLGSESRPKTYNEKHPEFYGTLYVGISKKKKKKKRTERERHVY